MDKIAIRADNLGKQYIIGRQKQAGIRFSEVLTSSLSAPLRWIRGGRSPLTASEPFWALRNVSFEVREGEVLGIVGPNGAGKSTLLKILSRIVEMTEGQVELYGRVGSLLEVGTGFHPELTGRENVYLNGIILGMKRSEVDLRFDEIVAFSGVERFLDTPVKRYSSGMYIRLAFAVAAHLESEILFVDEVLSVGDVEFQQKCLGKMSDISKGGRTVIFVSHNMNAIKALCNRAILLKAGYMSSQGDVDQVVADYLQVNDPLKQAGIILEDVYRVKTGDTAILRRATLHDAAGKQVTQIFLGQTIRISLVYEVKEIVERVAIEVGISTVDGLRVATICNLDREGAPLYFGRGLHQIAVEIDMDLLPGKYVVDAMFNDLGKGVTLDWVQHMLKFTALNVAEASNDHYPWNIVRGYVRPPSTWHVSAANPLQGDVVGC